MKDKLAIILFHAVLIGALLLAACAAPGQVAVNTPQGRIQSYPPTIEDTPQRRQAAQEAWKKFLAEFRLPDVAPDLEPVLNTPRALPPGLMGRIVLNTKTGLFGQLEAKEAMRRFIERASGVLFPDHTNSPAQGSTQGSIGLKDLSLVSFTSDGNFYRAVYRQASYPFQIEGGYGELRLAVGKDGTLLQWGSRIIPVFDLPARAEIASQSIQSIMDGMVGREFIYSNIAGQAMSYKVKDRSEVSVKDLVVYPKQAGNRITIHLAHPVEVGSGMTWTIYVDAITGQEIDVKQNFVS
ncbi:MAG: hypothetical protein AB7U82_05380 [Blastocatellales bacterium]